MTGRPTPASDPAAPIRNPVGFPGVLGLLAASAWLLWQTAAGLASGPSSPGGWFSVAMSGFLGVGFLWPAWQWLRGYTIRFEDRGLTFLGPFAQPVLIPWDQVVEVHVRTYPMAKMAGLVRRLELRWEGGRLVVPPTVDLTDAWEKASRQLTTVTCVMKDGTCVSNGGEPSDDSGD